MASKRPNTNEKLLKDGRPRRPLRADEGKLKIHGLDHDNFYYRWVEENNPARPGRVARLQEAGYELVHESEIKDETNNGHNEAQITGSVVRRASGSYHVVLMKIPKDWWEEDQKVKNETNKSILDRLHKGTKDEQKTLVIEGG